MQDGMIEEAKKHIRDVGYMSWPDVRMMLYPYGLPLDIDVHKLLDAITDDDILRVSYTKSYLDSRFWLFYYSPGGN